MSFNVLGNLTFAAGMILSGGMMIVYNARKGLTVKTIMYVLYTLLGAGSSAYAACLGGATTTWGAAILFVLGLALVGVTIWGLYKEHRGR